MAVQTTYNLTLTAAIEGQLADNGPHDIVARYNEEASAEIAFGRGVAFGTEDNGALLPAAETDKIVGITVHSHQYAAEDLGATGVVAGGALNILRKGRIWVMARTAVAPGDRLWVRAVSSETGFERYGGLEDADDGSDMIDCTAQGVWLTTAAQGALAVLEVDFTNKPA
jgi:hypothetical protein